MTRCTNTKVIVKSVGVQQIMIARRNNHMRPPLVFVNLPIGLITSGHMPSLTETIMRYTSMIRVMLLMDDL
jgi:hypothetical protein